jgi:phosphate-selective porin OprO and OprP
MVKLVPLLFVFFPLLTCPAIAQIQQSIPYQMHFGRGIGIVAPDSLYSLNLRFRMQNRAAYNSVFQTGLAAQPGGLSDFEMRVRRLRLRLEGFMYSPKLTYLVQLSFSRGDMDWSMRELSAVNTSPNVVRDAVIYYRLVRGLNLFFGQTKLPGNRQRVVSSGELQFVDRSIVNATFNIDRDFGFQAHYSNQLQGVYYNLRTAITTGDGRNVVNTDGGLAYTGRIELLPLGEFARGGDYFEGDVAREETVKISIAGGLSYNEKARRTGGQIGRDLFEQRDFQTYIFDGLLKFQGFALYAELMSRTADNPLTVNPAGEMRHIYTGIGENYQMSYNFKNNLEVAVRYAQVTPGEQIRQVAGQEDSYATGVTKYLRGHRLKLQANVSYHTVRFFTTGTNSGLWGGAVQMELGI